MCTETNYYNHIWQSINCNSQKRDLYIRKHNGSEPKRIKEKKLYTKWIPVLYTIWLLYLLSFSYILYKLKFWKMHHLVVLLVLLRLKNSTEWQKSMSSTIKELKGSYED